MVPLLVRVAHVILLIIRPRSLALFLIGQHIEHYVIKLILFYDQLKQHNYFHDLASSLKSKPGKFWRHFQLLSRRSKPTCDLQVLATADAFNDHFLSIPYNTIANVVSAVPASEYMDKFCLETVSSLEFVPVDVDNVSFLIWQGLLLF